MIAEASLYYNESWRHKGKIKTEMRKRARGYTLSLSRTSRGP